MELCFLKNAPCCVFLHLIEPFLRNKTKKHDFFLLLFKIYIIQFPIKILYKFQNN